MLSFRAPEEAVTLHVNAYRLSEDKTAWIDREMEDVVIGAAETPHPLAGFLTTQVMEDSSVRFHVNCGGISSFRTDALLPAQPRFSVLTAGLHAPAAITPDEEIPILFRFHVNCGGISSFRTDALLPAQPRFSVLTAGLHAPAAITPDEEIPILFIAYTTEGKSVRFHTLALLPAQPRFSVLTAGLHAPAAITPDEEIPILFIAYTTEGKSVRFHTLEDVLDPSDLKDADYAQLITLTFASKP